VSLTASEQRALAKIEHVLQSGDAGLRSLFGIFTRLTWPEAMPAREQLPQRGWRARPVIAVPLTLVLIAAIIVVGSLGGASAACGAIQRAAAAGSEPVPSIAGRSGPGCAQRTISWSKTP
jgi:hypothetical protein